MILFIGYLLPLFIILFHGAVKGANWGPAKSSINVLLAITPVVNIIYAFYLLIAAVGGNSNIDLDL